MKSGKDVKKNTYRLFRGGKTADGLYSIVVRTILIISAFTLVTLVAASPVGKPVTENNEGVFILADDWKYVNRDGKKLTISLPHDFSVPKGEKISLSRTLPVRLRPGPTIGFYSEYQNVTASISGKEIYSNGTGGPQRFIKTTPGGWNFISIPEDAGGDVLTLTFSSAYSRFSGKLPMIYYGERASLILSKVRESLPAIIATALLMLTGITLFTVTMTLLRKSDRYFEFKYLSVFTVLIALWVSGNMRYPDMHFMNHFVYVYIKFMALYLCPLPFAMFLRRQFNPKYSRIIDAFFLTFTLNFFVTLFLQLGGISDYEEMRPFTQVLFFIAIVACLIIYYRSMRRRVIYPSAEYAGIAVFTASVVICVAIYAFFDSSASVVVLSAGMFIYIITLFSASLKDIYKSSQHSAELDRELQQSKLQLLISQIQPHFIFNTLGALQSLIKSAPDRAYELSTDFAKHLRANIGALNSTSLIDFSKEIENIRTYLKIERVRFGDRLKVRYYIAVSDFRVPQLSIQPLVENAVKGVSRRVEGGTVTIISREEKGCYVVEVEDDGVGFEVKLLNAMAEENGSTGLKNITYRLTNMIDAKVEIDSVVGRGTRVTVCIPKTGENLSDG